MKYIRFLHNEKIFWGEIKGDKVFTLKNPPYEGINYGGEEYKLSDCVLCAPCEPSKIVCAGKNYYDHAIEMNEGVPENPIIFIKPNTCVNNPGGIIPYPVQTNRLDYEGELAFIIKKTAKNVKKEEAFDFIFGYTCLNDVTARDIQKSDGQWTRGKGFDGFAPIGPYLVSDIDPAALKITTKLNGEIKQSSDTSMFMWKIPELLSFITNCMTLLPGDIVATGTPAGIGAMKKGDIVEVEIENIGVLKNTIG